LPSEGSSASTRSKLRNPLVSLRRSSDILQILISWSRLFTTCRQIKSSNLGWRTHLKKPTLIFTTNSDAIFDGLRGAHVLRVAPNNLEQVGHDIDRFLRYATEASSIETQPPPLLPSRPLEWARDRLVNLRHEHNDDSAHAFEQLIFDLFTEVGGQAIEAKTGADRGVDLVVWMNDVAFETGGPILVESKYYGRASNITSNAKHTIERLEKLVAGSDASLALLIFDSDRPSALARIPDTPRVLTFPIEKLLNIFVAGTFTTEVLRRRRRAASVQGTPLASD
jgi:hypothetical protein